jgi:diaminopimelate decarboxylase
MLLDYSKLGSFSDIYGDSFYLLDTKKFEKNLQTFLFEFQKKYKKTKIGYSYKTNYIPALLKIVNSNEGYAEVVSEMEYDLAIKVGVSPENIIVNGPYKDKKALKKYLLNGSNVNLDSYVEAQHVISIANEFSSFSVSVGLRCNFEVQKNSVSRFGFDVGDTQFTDILQSLKAIRNIELNGLHCHFPDRSLESFISRAERILKLSDQIFDVPPKFIDIGGGYFGHMAESLKDQFSASVPSYSEYAEAIGSKFYDHYKNINEKDRPELILEPGSALVGDVMSFVARIIDIKNVRGKSIATSSGSRFNIGLITSKINMPVCVYNRPVDNIKFPKIDIAGYTCIENDILYYGYEGELGIGSFIAFSNVGSYSIVFKPPFIMPNVPVISCDDNDEVTVIKKEETLEDIFSTYTF